MAAHRRPARRLRRRPGDAPLPRLIPQDRLWGALRARLADGQPAGELCAALWRRAAGRPAREVWETALALAPLGLVDPTALRASLAASAALVALAPDDDGLRALRGSLLARAGRAADPARQVRPGRRGG